MIAGQNVFAGRSNCLLAGGATWLGVFVPLRRAQPNILVACLKVSGPSAFHDLGCRPGRLARMLAIALLLAFAGAVQALAQEPPPQGDEPGFFSRLPSPPKLKLPDIRIPFWTDDLKTARKAYNSGNYSRALKYFQRSSDDGSLVADWYLGHMYRTGRGVEQDDGRAFSYYSRVAEQFDPDEESSSRRRIMIDAQLRLADYYRTGIVARGIEHDHARAYAMYLRFGTAYGHPAAFYGLGAMNINGQGVKRNPRQGLKWMMAAARKRYAPAEAYMGDAYWTGRIVVEDRTRALMYYILAAQSAAADDNPEIFDRLELMRSAAREDQLLEAEARAKVWDQQFPVQGKPE